MFIKIRIRDLNDSYTLHVCLQSLGRLGRFPQRLMHSDFDKHLFFLPTVLKSIYLLLNMKREKRCVVAHSESNKCKGNA